MDTWPGVILAKVKLEYRLTSGSVFITPWQLGPKRRIPSSPAISTISRSILAPSWLSSLKPEVLTMHTFTPFSAQSRRVGATRVLRTMTWARSTSWGTSLMDLDTSTPRISPPLGLTGVMEPLKP